MEKSFSHMLQGHLPFCTNLSVLIPPYIVIHVPIPDMTDSDSFIGKAGGFIVGVMEMESGGWVPPHCACLGALPTKLCEI